MTATLIDSTRAQVAGLTDLPLTDVIGIPVSYVVKVDGIQFNPLVGNYIQQVTAVSNDLHLYVCM